MKTYQVITSDHVIVGGASPNNFFTVDSLLKEQIFERLKKCNKSKQGPMVTEVKFVVVYFHNTP